MFNEIKRSLLGAVFLALPLAANAATVINFDTDGLGNPILASTAITNQYANLGVSFLGLEDGSPVDILATADPDGGTEPSSPNVLANCSTGGSGCGGIRADIVRIGFLTSVSQISLQLNTLGSESVTFQLFDGLNNVLETQTVTSGGSLFVPVSFAASGVTRIDGLQPFDGWAWAIDDLTFSAAVIPVPAPLLLLGTGLLGLAALRRRKAA